MSDEKFNLLVNLIREWLASDLTTWKQAKIVYSLMQEMMKQFTNKPLVSFLKNDPNPFEEI